MAFDQPAFWLALLQIIWIDILLSGDNAVVIALACRKLAPEQRKLGILLGAGAAVALRIGFALVISYLLAVPFLKLAGGFLLFWIAVKLVIDEHDSHGDVEASSDLWGAVRTIAVADAVMSLDNVVAIAAASRGHPELFVIGLVLTIPLIIAGSSFLTTVLQSFPVLVWAGGALLGWIAGEMIVGDPAVLDALGGYSQSLVVADPEEAGARAPAALPHYAASAAGALIVLVAGFLLKRRRSPVVAGTDA